MTAVRSGDERGESGRAPGPRTGRIPGVFLLIGSVTALLAVVFAFVRANQRGWYWAVFDDATDVHVYHAAAKVLAGGGNVYGGVLIWSSWNGQEGALGLPFTYPPFAAVAFLPMALLSVDGAAYVFFAVSVLALCAVIWTCMRSLGYRTDRRMGVFVALALVSCFLLEPVRLTLGLGQINNVLLALILVDLLLVPPKYRGIGLGIAAGIKLTPLLFVVYLLLNRGYRTALIASLTFAATVVIGFLAMPRPAAGFWVGQMTQTDRIGAVDRSGNQSVNGIMSQILRWAQADWSTRPGDMGVVYAAPGWMWVPVALAVVVSGLIVAVAAHRRGCELYALVVVGMTAALVSPVAWTHHWVWVLPALLVAIDWAQRGSAQCGSAQRGGPQRGWAPANRPDLVPDADADADARGGRGGWRWLVPLALLAVAGGYGLRGLDVPPDPLLWYHWVLFAPVAAGYSILWLITVVTGAVVIRDSPDSRTILRPPPPR